MLQSLLVQAPHADKALLPIEHVAVALVHYRFENVAIDFFA